MNFLDTLRAFVYNRFPVAAVLVAVAACLMPGTASAADTVLGVPMPKRASKLGPNRYVVTLRRLNLKDAVKFFKKKLKGASPEVIEAIEHPRVQVVHIRSGRSSTTWEGINLAIRKGRIYIYVIPRKAPADAG